MASLSQALRLGDLPPPHRTFQGHATHIIEWSMMLRPNDSWSTCILQGIATFLHYASRRSASPRYATHLSIEEYHARITVPALNIGGWYDIFLGGTLRNYRGMRAQGATQEARQGQKLLIGPW